MPRGNVRNPHREVRRAIRAFQDATKLGPEDICVDFHGDGSYTIHARSADLRGPPNPQAADKPLADNMEIVL